MVNLTQLSAAEMAAQLARPTGDIGVAVGDYMTNLNSRLINAAYALLSPPVDGRLLEIGFGNGKAVTDLFELAPNLTYVGVDVSETMVSEASKNNHANVEQGRVKLYRASADRLPFPDRSFDRALAINSIYFWPDQLNGLAEIQRVLRADGSLVLASMTPETSAQSSTARPEFGFKILDSESLTALHREAGFKRVACDLYAEEAKRLDGTIFRRAYLMVLAHKD